MSDRSKILGITYSEFDNKVGPRLKYCYPPNVMSSEAFESFSDYIIVSKQLCQKLITVCFDDIQFINCCVAIENPKYDRNCLNFAFGFLLTKDANTNPFGVFLKNLTNTFVNLEVVHD